MKIILVFFMFLSMSQINAAPLRYLVKTIVPQTAFDTPPRTWNNPSDDDSLRRNIGFSFPFNNTTYTRLRISTNGGFTFGGDGDFAYQNTALPYFDISVYPYWDDLNPSSAGQIRYGRLDSGGANDRFVISWEGIPHYNNSGSYSFQAVIYPDGRIRFRYDSTSDADGTLCGGGCTDYGNSGATIGVQETSAYYDQHSFNAAIDQTKDILYTIPSSFQITKESCVISDPINLSVNPKRIPGATIRYAIELSNFSATVGANMIVDDTVNTGFDTSTIRNLQIQNGNCNCLGVVSASNNPSPGTGNGVSPIKLNFQTLSSGSISSPTVKCGYFEVDIN